MDSRPQAIFFNVVRGAAEPSGPLARVSPSRGLAAGPTLLLLAEPEGKATAEQARVFLDVVLSTFRRSSGSLTSRLTGALQVARRQILGLEEDADLAALCAVVTAEGVYLASVGETHAYLISSSSGRRRLEFPHLPAATGAGDVRLLRVEPTAGEALLAVTGEVARHTEAAGVLAHTLSPPSSLMRDLWQQSQGGDLAAAVCFIFGRGRPQVSDLAREKARRTPKRRRALAGAWTGASRARGWFRPRWRGHQMASLPAPPLRQRLRPVLLLLLLSIVLAAIVAGAIRLPALLATQAASHRARLVQQAEEAYSAAEEATTKTERREQLVRSLSFLDEAGTDEAPSEAALDLRTQVQEALKALDARHQLTGWQVIVETPKTPLGGPRLRGLTFGGGQAYVLDQQRGAVYGFQLTETEEGRLVPRLATAGPAAFTDLSIHTVGWVDATGPGQRATLILVNEERRLFAMAADGALQELALREADELNSLTAVDSQEGRLYVLDGLDGQVWRYSPTDRGYDSERRSVAASRAMTDAVDLAVHQAVFVLTRSGGIFKFLAGRPDAFTQDGLDRPLDRPAAIFCDRTNDLLYVADGGNDRIVVFSTDGTFLRQYVAPELAGVRDVAVDTSQAILYVLAGERLLATRLPD